MISVIFKKGGIKCPRKFPQKAMVYLGVFSEGVTPLVIVGKGTVNREVYIDKVLPIVLSYGRNVLGDNLTFQQNGPKPHVHKKTQNWCCDHFPSFMDKGGWPTKSPDLNPLEYSIWDDFMNSVNCNRATSTKTIVSELKTTAEKFRQSLVFESYSSWTNRLYRMNQANRAF